MGPKSLGKFYSILRVDKEIDKEDIRSDMEKVKSLPLADTHFQISAKVQFQI